jgi:hypothetical protein
MTNTSASIAIPIAIISTAPVSISPSFRFCPSLIPVRPEISSQRPCLLPRAGGAKVRTYCSTARRPGRSPTRDTAQAMSQESFEVVAELARDFEQGDWVRVRALFTDDAELQPPEGWPEAGPFFGRNAIVREFRRIQETWGTNRVAVAGLAEEEDRPRGPDRLGRRGRD